MTNEQRKAIQTPNCIYFLLVILIKKIRQRAHMHPWRSELAILKKDIDIMKWFGGPPLMSWIALPNP